MNKIFSVSELTGLIKQTLEEGFAEVTLEGEISNFKKHVSGHWYFTLKDSGAQISATMWKGLNSYVFFSPDNGMKVLVKGKISVYPPRGNYQIDVKSMKPAGIGELQAAYEKLKEKLNDEGLFENEYKKPVKKMPSKIGIVTAIGGAAFRDMISVAERRFPLAELVIAPAAVQGAEAAPEIVKSIDALNKRSDIDTIIVGRGGGSLEDLWAFNEEIVARTIFASKIPVISAVGHEIDFTISDFVADMRAPTPSAAMELATPSIDELIAFIREFFYYSSSKLKEKILSRQNDLGRLLKSYGFRQPVEKNKYYYQTLDNLLYRINGSADKLVKDRSSKLEIAENKIKKYDLNKILGRGFALIQQNGGYVTKSTELDLQSPFTIKFDDNEVKVDING